MKLSYLQPYLLTYLLSSVGLGLGDGMLAWPRTHLLVFAGASAGIPL